MNSFVRRILGPPRFPIKSIDNTGPQPEPYSPESPNWPTQTSEPIPVRS